MFITHLQIRSKPTIFNFIIVVHANIIEIHFALHQLTALLLPVNDKMLVICRELTAYTFNCVSINIKDLFFDQGQQSDSTKIR